MFCVQKCFIEGVLYKEGDKYRGGKVPDKFAHFFSETPKKDRTIDGDLQTLKDIGEEVPVDSLEYITKPITKDSLDI